MVGVTIISIAKGHAVKCLMTIRFGSRPPSVPYSPPFRCWSIVIRLVHKGAWEVLISVVLLHFDSFCTLYAARGLAGHGVQSVWAVRFEF